jgi:hypothetical protein
VTVSKSDSIRDRFLEVELEVDDEVGEVRTASERCSVWVPAVITVGVSTLPRPTLAVATDADAVVAAAAVSSFLARLRERVVKSPGTSLSSFSCFSWCSIGVTVSKSDSKRDRFFEFEFEDDDGGVGGVGEVGIVREGCCLRLVDCLGISRVVWVVSRVRE